MVPKRPMLIYYIQMLFGTRVWSLSLCTKTTAVQAEAQRTVLPTRQTAYPRPSHHLPQHLPDAYRDSHTTESHCLSRSTTTPRKWQVSLDTHSRCLLKQSRELHIMWIQFPMSYVKSIQDSLLSLSLKRTGGLTPIKFHTPMCHPSTFGAGIYHFCCVSTMKRNPETMKPVPPITCGSQ